MVTLDEVISLISIIYSDILEPVFCFFYAYILIRIFRAKSLHFRSEFFVFTIATEQVFEGVAAIGYLLLNWIYRLIDRRFQFFPNRGLFLNIDNMLSHICAVSTTIGKTLSVSTRFTAIHFMHSKHIWDVRAIPICVLVMFGLPSLLYSYFPAFPAVFAPTPNGYGTYLGIANPGFLICKGIATSGYLIFFLSTVPMCTLSVLKLRRHRLQSAPQSADCPDKRLIWYAVALTTSHMVKCVLQTIWFLALLSEMKELQMFISDRLVCANAVSAFAEPVLLLFTSPKLRKEPYKMNHRALISLIIAIYLDAGMCHPRLYHAGEGKLVCSAPFKSRVRFWEIDNVAHGAVNRPGNFVHAIKNGTSEKPYNEHFNIYEMVKDDASTDIPLMMTIEHNCGTEYACVCKDFGKERKTNRIFDLEKSDMKHCDICKHSRKQRSKGDEFAHKA